MLRYEDVIEKLTLNQKLEVLSGSFGDLKGELGEGWEDLQILRLDEEATAYGLPSFKSIASSWNSQLIAELSKTITFKSSSVNPVLAITPNVGVMLSPYSAAISEDPYLSGIFATDCARGVVDGGAIPVLSGCGLDKGDSDYTDKMIGKHIVRDYIMLPYESTLKKVNSCALLMEHDRNNPKSENISQLIDQNLKNYRYYDYKNVRKIVIDSNFCGITKHDSKNIILNADKNKLKKALAKYQELTQARDDGKITSEEINEALESGIALNEESIDRAVIRVLEFASECQKQSLEVGKFSAISQPQPIETLTKQAIKESVILLKNKNVVLPFEDKVNIAVIGSEGKHCADYMSDMTNNIVNYVGYAEGYGEIGTRDDQLIIQAQELMESSDVAVVFCGRELCRSQNGIALPPNRLALLDALRASGKSIIAVIPAGVSVDMAFEDYCDGIIALPQCGLFECEVLIDVLTGIVNPSGKLTYTLYKQTDKTFAEISDRIAKNRRKIGKFFGYRGYETTNMQVAYPFGHGLSYSDFVYSGLRINKRWIKFTVKNESKYFGTEIAQVYFGIPKSSVVRPEKELKSFVRAEIPAGKSRTFKVLWSANDLGENDFADGERKVEAGMYDVSIGTAAEDIRLEGKVKIDGENFHKGQEKISDFSDEESNIVSGEYTLLEMKKPVKKPKRIWVCSFFILLIAVSDFFLMNLDLRGDFVEGMLILLNVFVLPPIIWVMVKSIVKYKRKIKASKKQTTPTQHIKLTGDYKLEDLFEQEFCVSKENSQSDNVPSGNYNENIEKYIDHNLTIGDIRDHIIYMMTDKGYPVSKEEVRNIIASMYASRVLIIKSEYASQTQTFLNSLAASMGTQLISKTEDESFVSLIQRVAQLAHNNNHLIHILSLENISTSQWGEELRSIVSYASNPEISELLPANVWVAATTQERLPIEVAEISVVIDITQRAHKEITVTENINQFCLNYYQFMSIANNCLMRERLSETLWKRVDKLEEHSLQKANYRISNKLWRSMERYSAVLLAFNADGIEVIDAVIGAKLIAVLVKALNGGLSAIDGGLSSVLDRVLDGGSAISLGLLKYWSSIPSIVPVEKV